MSNITISTGGNEKKYEYAEGVYLVFNEEGQGEFVIPNIEKYKILDGVKVNEGEEGKVGLYCPNVRIIDHKLNQWSKVDESTIECSECGAKMDISRASGRAIIEEAKK